METLEVFSKLLPDDVFLEKNGDDRHVVSRVSDRPTAYLTSRSYRTTFAFRVPEEVTPEKVLETLRRFDELNEHIAQCSDPACHLTRNCPGGDKWTPGGEGCAGVEE